MDNQPNSQDFTDMPVGMAQSDSQHHPDVTPEKIQEMELKVSLKVFIDDALVNFMKEWRKSNPESNNEIQLARIMADTLDVVAGSTQKLVIKSRSEEKA